MRNDPVSPEWLSHTLQPFPISSSDGTKKKKAGPQGSLSWVLGFVGGKYFCWFLIRSLPVFIILPGLCYSWVILFGIQIPISWFLSKYTYLLIYHRFTVLSQPLSFWKKIMSEYFICMYIMYIPCTYLVLLYVEEGIRSPDTGVKAAMRGRKPICVLCKSSKCS